MNETPPGSGAAPPPEAAPVQMELLALPTAPANPPESPQASESAPPAPVKKKRKRHGGRPRPVGSGRTVVNEAPSGTGAAPPPETASVPMVLPASAPAPAEPPESSAALPPTPPSPPPTKKKRKRHIGRTLLLLVVLLLEIAVDAWIQLHAPMEIPADTTMELSAGERFDHCLGELDARGLFATMRQRAYLMLYARATHEASAIRAGEYRLDPGMTPLQLIALMKSGKVVLHELRLIEGWRFAQALQTLADDPDVQHTLAGMTPAEIMRSLGLANADPEGQFFPDTYRFPKHTSDVALLRQANAALERILAAEWTDRAQDLPYDSPQQALIMASIVEKETGVAAERAQIAGVFVRRLRLGMRLQTDPTVIYGVGQAYDGSLHTRDLMTDTPYNTYTRAGLPPTPICLPGRESIHAALHPDNGHALYFVSRGDNTHQFSDTLEEHNAAVHRYIPGAR